MCRHVIHINGWLHIVKVNKVNVLRKGYRPPGIVQGPRPLKPQDGGVGGLCIDRIRAPLWRSEEYLVGCIRKVHCITELFKGSERDPGIGQYASYQSRAFVDKRKFSSVVHTQEELVRGTHAHGQASLGVHAVAGWPLTVWSNGIDGALPSDLVNCVACQGVEILDQEGGTIGLRDVAFRQEEQRIIAVVRLDVRTCARVWGRGVRRYKYDDQNHGFPDPDLPGTRAQLEKCC